MFIGFDAKRLFHNNTGLGNYSRSLINALSEHYSKNSYLLYNPKPETTHRFQPKANTIEKRPNSFFSKMLNSLWRQKYILNQLKSDGIDIYHGLSGELPWGIEKTSIKTVVTIHDLIFLRYPKLYNPIDRFIYYHKFKYAAHKSDIIIAISEQTKKDIIAFLGVSQDKIKVIYQGCDAVFKKKYSDEDKTLLREKYSLPDSFILNVGTVETRKNVLTAVKAIKNINTSLVIVGSGKDYKDRVISYILENKMQYRVHFLDGLSLKEIAILYQMAKVFVFPSIFEGFGIPIIEALYSKTPVITSKGSCFSEAGGSHSLYVESYDYKAVRDSIKMLLEDEDKRQKQIDLGYDFVQKFNDKTIAQEYYEVYHKLL